MKGNRGPRGRQFPSVRVDPFDPIDTGQPLARRTRLHAWGVVSLVVALLAITGVVAAVFFDRDTASAPASLATPEATAIQLDTPTVLATPQQPTPAPSPTTAPTSSPAAAPTPTATGTATPTAVPAQAGPPTVRTRYIVKTGDGCEPIRIAFKYAIADFEEFQLAMGRLSGRTPANQCVLNQGNVLCLPAQQDLANVAALTRDDKCLAGP